MAKYNLQLRQREILRQFARVLEDGGDGSFLLANGLGAVFAASDISVVDCTDHDIRLFVDQGLVTASDSGSDGMVLQSVVDAVRSDFELPSHVGGAPQIGVYIAGNVSGSTLQSAFGNHNTMTVGDGAASAERLQMLTMDLVSLVRQLIDADEARAAEREASAIAEELKKEVPDKSVIIRKAKGFVGRISSLFSGAADLAENGEKIASFAERLAPWILLIAKWTEAK